VEKVARLAASPTLEHLLATNQFFVALLATARVRAGCELVQWWSARRTAETTGEYVRPDDYGHWHDTTPDGQRREVRFFLEYDRGRENLTTVVGKLDRYRAMTVAGVNHPVLFVFDSPVREHNFHTQTVRAGWPRTLHIATTIHRHHRPALRPGPASSGGRGHDEHASPADRIWLPVPGVGPGSTGGRRGGRGDDFQTRRALIDLD
jgi:hypothetical protein